MAKSLTILPWTIAIGASIAAGSPLAAQSSPAPPTTNTVPPDAVGPAQLRDFSLNGTVTQRAEPPPPAASQRPPATRPAPRAPQPRAQAPTEPPAAEERPAQRELPPSSPRATDPSRPPPALPSGGETSSVPAVVPGPSPATVASEVPSDTPPQVPDEPSRWPWLLALVAALAGAYFLWQRRSRPVGGIAYPATPSAPPAPLPVPRRSPAEKPVAEKRAPEPASNPEPPIAGGIVARGLKPSLSFELEPIRVDTDGSGAAALLCDVVVRNNGSAPARDVLVETQMFNAGPRQDEDIGRFFREPNREGPRIAVIPPMDKVVIKSRIGMTAEQLVPVEVEGRKLLVPLIAFNALYRWSGGEEQESASFLIGRGERDNGKMAPFRLDSGPRSYGGLGVRVHSLGLERA